jgi:2-methylcitrate dehydratase PrpD
MATQPATQERQHSEAERSLTEALAAKALAIRFENLPSEIVELSRQCFLDWLGVTIAGASEPLVQILAEQVKADGGNHQASLIGRREKVSVNQAALVNGAASHALDYDDVNLTLEGHPSVAVIPGLLALAEMKQVSGADFISAFVAGYETACRIGEVVSPGHYRRGFHATATVGSFGSAAACAHLLRLDQKQTAMAFGIAGTQAAGLKSMFGTMCKPLHAGKAAQNGLMAALLASRGFDSRIDVLECAQGFAATQSEDFDAEAALAEPKDGFHIRANLFKYHAACYLTHAAIECALRLRQRLGARLDGIKQVVVRVFTDCDRVCNIPEPKTGLEAKFSLRLATAFALAGLDTSALLTYCDKYCADPNLISLRDKVRVELVPGWTLSQSEVRLILNDGQVLEETHDSGIPAADIREQRTRLTNKFHGLVNSILGTSATSDLIESIFELDRLPNLISVIMQSNRLPVSHTT